MNRIKFLMTSAMALMSLSTVVAQDIDFNDPAYAKWGNDAVARKKNMIDNSYMKEALDNKEFNAAAGYFNSLINTCPEASEAIFARGVILYKNKINRARTLADKKMMVDSLMLVHDLRIQYYGNHPTRGTVYILDSKARDQYNYDKSNREGIRLAFRAAIEAAGEKSDPELVMLYFQNLCEDYKMDEVMSDEVMAEYERLTPFFVALPEDKAELRAQFDNTFGLSGVASCENLEILFRGKLEANPDDTQILSQALAMMERAKCNTPYSVELAERYYKLSPTADAAMSLAAVFQNKGDYSKASTYLRDALASETDAEEREKLLSRIAIVEMAANRMGAAATAARAALDTPDGTYNDNGIALFVLAQCYASAAAGCQGVAGETTYWVAYDTMQKALNSFTAEEESYKAPARDMLSKYAASFPTKENCFFEFEYVDTDEGKSHTVTCGLANGIETKIRYRKE
ncbi:MAG: enzyme of heme biosynthesis [Rikenellaceae bacterium]